MKFHTELIFNKTEKTNQVVFIEYSSEIQSW